MTIIVGVDGGGSKTHAVVVDEQGRQLGVGLAGCGNHQGPGIEVALANVQKAVNTALTQAGLTADDVDFVQYGLAGADRQHDFDIIRPALKTLPYQNWDVVCDTMEGLRCGSPNNVGVVLVCGSGTNAMGRSADGKMVQIGGFGTLFGDAAGGDYLARETFRAAVRSWEYREAPSVLTERVAHHLGFESMEEVYHHYLDHELDAVPLSLTLVLHDAAADGDALAIRILQSTGHELGLAANSVVRRLGTFGDESFPVVLVGSVLQRGRGPHLLDALRDTVLAENPRAYFVIPDMAPVYGAVLLGMDHLGIQASPEIINKFVSYGGYDQ